MQMSMEEWEASGRRPADYYLIQYPVRHQYTQTTSETNKFSHAVATRVMSVSTVTQSTCLLQRLPESLFNFSFNRTPCSPALTLQARLWLI